MSYYPVPIRYQSYQWNPPTLSPQEEIEMGGRIHRRGKEAFRKEFLSPPPAPKETIHTFKTVAGHGNPPNFVMREADPKQEMATATPPVVPVKDGKKMVKVAGLAALVTATAITAPAVLVTGLGMGLCAGLYGGGISYGSRRYTLWKFNRWMDRCLAKYTSSLKAGQTRVIYCAVCAQGLRIPKSNRRVQAKCPRCGAGSTFPDHYAEDGQPRPEWSGLRKMYRP